MLLRFFSFSCPTPTSCGQLPLEDDPHLMTTGEAHTTPAYPPLSYLFPHEAQTDLGLPEGRSEGTTGTMFFISFWSGRHYGVQGSPPNLIRSPNPDTDLASSCLQSPLWHLVLWNPCWLCGYTHLQPHMDFVVTWPDEASHAPLSFTAQLENGDP